MASATNSRFPLIAYLLTIPLLLAIGTFYTALHEPLNTLRWVGIGIVMLACSASNLLYFIPVKWPALRFLAPGLICIAAFYLLNGGSSVERSFSTSFGVINLSLGILWLLINLSRQKNS